MMVLSLLPAWSRDIRYCLTIPLLLSTMVFEVISEDAKATSECPRRCECFQTTVRCMFQQLMVIPIMKIPLDTTVLDLRFNKIARIRKHSLQDLKHLETLLLNNNEINQISDGAFAGLNKLKTLYLYNNQLTAISNQTFRGLTGLQFLYLQHNKIYEIHRDAFAALPKLQRLLLNNNLIRTMPYGALRNLANLDQLRLDSNALVCDCKLLWLAMMMDEKKEEPGHQHLDLVGVDCMYPTDMRGKSLIGMGPDDLHCSRPKIMEEPKSVEVRFGETAYFKCRVDGDPTPEIVWMKNNSEVLMTSLSSSNADADDAASDRNRYSLLDDGTLMIADARPEDRGFYECMAKSPAGAVRTRRAELRYYGLEGYPRIILPPRDVEVSVGSPLRLSCGAIGFPQPRIKWSFDGREVIVDNNLEVLTNGDLVVKHVNRGHFGTYTCTAFNRNGQAVSSARAYGRSAPEFTIRPTEVAATEGTSVQLICEATGYPQPTITWYRRNSPIRPSRNIQIGSSGSPLVIEAVSRQDADEYVCHARNQHGAIRAAASIRLRNVLAPRITVAPNPATVRRHESAVFNCVAEGEPKPRILWLFNGSPIPTVRGHYEVTADNSLYVHDVSDSDAGHYGCQAGNDVGSASADAKLTVKEDQYNQLVDQKLIYSSLAQARQSVDRAINATRDLLYDGQPKTPSELLTLFRYPGPQAVELARAREIYEQTLNLIHQHIQRGLYFNATEFTHENVLSEAHLQLISQLSGCRAHRDDKQCNDMCFHKRYRSYDGTCNNLQHPMQGASLTAFKRLLPPIYENGFNTPVGWNRDDRYHGFRKPSARLVSTTVVAAPRITQDREYTHMLMQWGQFMDHDLDFAVVAAARSRFESGLDCKRACINEPPCFNIEIPPSDPRIREARCMEFERNSAVCGSGETSIFMSKIMPREQINQITNYIDASSVYGSSEDDALELRDLFSEHGLLKFDVVSRAKKAYLPFNRNAPMDCRRNASAIHRVRCMMAGDYRANEQLGLLATHTLFLREHNRIAGQMLNVNPHWDGERIYQETRKILGAQLQHITYAHWLPKIIGSYGMNLIGPYKGYDPAIDAGVSNAFATAAFRFGHSLINPVLLRLNESFQPIPEGHIPLHMAFFTPERLLNEGGIDPLLRGLFAAPAKVLRQDQFLNKELTEKLFALAENVALDLAAINIQRGRDHALPGYGEWRKWCNLTVPERWDDLASDIPDPNLRQKLKRLYGHPANIDLWVAGLSEQPLPGARIGPTFICIIADQFKRSRDGDRFWYENPGVFDSVQLAELRRVTLAKILCHNGDNIDRVQEDVFRYVGADISAFKHCSDIEDFNINAWQECCSESCQEVAEAEAADETTDEILGSAGDSETSAETENVSSVKQEHRTDRGSAEEEIPNQIEVNVSSRRKRHRQRDLKSHQQPLVEAATLLHDETLMNTTLSRLENLEGIVLQLASTIQELMQKTNQLEFELRRGTSNSSSCRDDSIVRNAGDEWTLDSCTTCSCKNGQIWCLTKSCQKPKCSKPRHLPFLCCPVC